MSYQMTIEDASRIGGSMLGLWAEHGKEVYGKININWYELTDIYRNGRCKFFVLWHNEEAVGYSFWITGFDFMQAHLLRADELAVYVQKPHRGRPAIRFLKFCEMKLRDMGFNQIVRYTQPNNPLTRVLEKLGYNTKEYLMVKEF